MTKSLHALCHFCSPQSCFWSNDTPWLSWWSTDYQPTYHSSGICHFWLHHNQPQFWARTTHHLTCHAPFKKWQMLTVHWLQANHSSGISHLWLHHNQPQLQALTTHQLLCHAPFENWQMSVVAMWNVPLGLNPKLWGIRSFETCYQSAYLHETPTIVC